MLHNSTILSFQVFRVGRTSLNLAVDHNPCRSGINHCLQTRTLDRLISALSSADLKRSLTCIVARLTGNLRDVCLWFLHCEIPVDINFVLVSILQHIVDVSTLPVGAHVWLGIRLRVHPAVSD